MALTFGYYRRTDFSRFAGLATFSLVPKTGCGEECRAIARSQCCSELNRYRIETRPVLTNPDRG